MSKLPKYVNIIKTPEGEQNALSLTKNLKKLPYDLQREDGLSFVQNKDVVAWINRKTRQNNTDLNYYAFDRRDYSELNQILNKLSDREVELESKGYDLNGVRSFNRNIWLDLSRESNAIEGIMEDFSFDLLDFRTKLKETIITDPKSKNFDENEYFQDLLSLYEKLDKTKPYAFKGNVRMHELDMDTIRHFIAFKYAYKCAKQHKATGKLTSQELISIIHHIIGLLSGTEYVPYRTIPIYIQKVVDTTFLPVKHEKIPDKLDALANFVANKDSGGQNLHPIEKAAIAHTEYIRIHPYVDGNHRSARILANFILIQNEIPTISLRHQNFEEYMLATNKAILTHEIDDLIEIFYKAALNSANIIDECVDYTEKKQKHKVEENFERNK